MHHVLFVVNNYPPRVGGVEIHVAALAREIVRSGHKATVVTLSTAASDTVEDGVRVIRIPQGRSIGSVFALPRRQALKTAFEGLENTGVTAVSTQTRFFPMTWRGVSLSRRLGVPLVHTEHGSDFVKGVPAPIAVASRIVDITLGRHALRLADTVLGVSEAVVQFVQRLSGVRAELFYNAIDVPDLDPEDVERRPEFVFVGRLVPGKGADLAVMAMAVLRKRGIPARLVMLGDGPMRATLEDAAKERGLADVIEFKGRVQREQVIAHLAGAILVNPSTLSEGFQTTLIEAAASGAQIVTYPLAGVEALRAADAPVHVVKTRDIDALANAMELAIVEPRPVWTTERVQAWSWNARAQEYLGILDKVVRDNSGRKAP
jgi:glycosyltransferase involved in cell wall biosynthesis